jgi:AmmeMemoRadiSam system protein B
VAGLFYPDDADRLRAAVAGLLAAATDPDPPLEALAVVAPHAGYRYSGPTAAVAHHAVAGRRAATDRVVLVGPAHHAAVAGVGVSTARAWRMPLGEVPVDVEACRALVASGAAVEADDAHAPEHSLEVQVPFLFEVLGPVPIVPLVVGRSAPDRVAAALDRLWDGDTTLVVASSDLSHYLDEDAARARDDRTCRAVVEGRTADIGPHDACGSAAVGGLLHAAGARGLAARTLAVSTSAAASGDRSRVVGYASFGFERRPPLDDAEQGRLLHDRRARPLGASPAHAGEEAPSATDRAQP